MDPIVALSRERIEKGSRSFAVAARLFPPDVRDSATMLYAWCRHCDDVIDDQVLGEGGGAIDATAGAKLAQLRAQTVEALAGRAGEPVFVGLHRVASKHGIPERLPLDLLEGMAMDVRGQAYATLDDTLRYAYHVAGCVGLMMAMIMGVRERAVLQRACDLGIAFQLTNIVRDVMGDAAVARIYLPADLLAAQGLTAADVGAPRHRAGVLRVGLQLLDAADGYYASAGEGIAHLPFRCACAVAAARRIYRGIGAVVRARGVAAWDSRARTSKAAVAAGLAAAGVEAATAIALRGWRSPASREGLWTPVHLRAEACRAAGAA